MVIHLFPSQKKWDYVANEIQCDIAANRINIHMIIPIKPLSVAGMFVHKFTDVECVFFTQSHLRNYL